MDVFAQSRDVVDLFDDEIIPIKPTEVRAVVETLPEQLQDISLEGAPKGPAAGANYHRGYNASGARGRGERGRGFPRANRRQQSSALEASRHGSTSKQSNRALAASAPTAIPPNLSQPIEGECTVPPIPTKHPEDQTTTDPAHRTEPSTPERPPAVRGDRAATGGVKKPKHTDEELTAILKKAAKKSETRSALHALAEADAANFAAEQERINAAEQERINAAEQERIKDAAKRKAMEGEREKNRARKMAVMGRREWDATKNEVDFEAACKGASGRADDNLKQYRWNGDRGVKRGQSRRRGGGGGRGASGVTLNYRNDAGVRPDVAAEIDFPALPATAKRNGEEPGWEQDKGSPGIVSATTGADSWADQVEMSEATKPTGG